MIARNRTAETKAKQRESLKRAAGFTLIELIVAVVIIGILAAIAIPSYRDYIIRSNRSGAQQYMLGVSNAQEQYRLDNRSYADPSPDTAIAAVLGPSMEPPTDLTGKYTFSISGGGADYQIIADAINSQASDGDLGLDNLGRKTPTEKW